MKNQIQFEEDLSLAWKSFMGTLSCKVAALEIRKGIDSKLLADLKKSEFLRDRVEKLSPNHTKWPESREREWAEARRLELLMENSFKDILGGADFKRLSFLSSISHTGQTHGLVVGISCLFDKTVMHDFQGVGVDIELADREIKDEVVSRFLNIQEKTKSLPLLPIDYWVMKEAAFKATPRDLQLVVTQYQLHEWNQELKEGLMVSKNVRCPVKLVDSSGYRVGLSYFRF